MATQSIDTTETPTQLATTEGNSYLVQNTFDNPLHLAAVSGNVAPSGAALRIRFTLDGWEYQTFHVGTGETLWCWSDAGHSGRASYDATG